MCKEKQECPPRSFKQQVIVLALSLMVLMPNMVATFVAIDLGSFWMRLLYFIGSILLFLITATILKARAFFMLQSLTLIVSLIEITHFIINKATTSLLFVYTIIISEPGEAMELWSTIWPIIVVLALLVVLYWIIIFHRLDNTYLFPSKIRRYIAYVTLLSGLLFLGAYKANDTLLVTFEIPIHNEKIRTKYLSFGEKIFPLNLALHVYKIAILNNEIENQKEQVESFSFGIKPQKK
jgi:glucan phosphoethanolaminetransferase (alkaline phosphatase superfamily)